MKSLYGYCTEDCGCLIEVKIEEFVWGLDTMCGCLRGDH